MTPCWLEIPCSDAGGGDKVCASLCLCVVGEGVVQFTISVGADI